MDPSVFKPRPSDAHHTKENKKWNNLFKHIYIFVHATYQVDLFYPPFLRHLGMATHVVIVAILLSRCIFWAAQHVIV